jgi:hypothetical protein
MPSPTEELSSQSQQLLDVISFFRIAEEGRKKVQATVKTAFRAAADKGMQVKQASSSPVKPAWAHAMGVVENAAGGALNMTGAGKKDNEFERY